VIFVFVSACGTPVQTVDYQQLAEEASLNSDYKMAIEKWNQYISDQKAKELDVEPKAYAELGKAYFQLENYELAESNFEMAEQKGYSDNQMYVMMAQRYRMIDNLSKELSALKFYRDHYPNAKDSSMMRNRLFEAYIESENWKPALETWETMDLTSQQEEKNLQYYFDLNKELEQNDACDELAQELLVLNPSNETALDWMAKKYYNLAENRYQRAMAAYDKNKTNKQYKMLLNDLDRVTADFKKSLQYFEPLWEMKDGKKYASYLANIYARFDDKKKSQYYKSFIK